MSVPLSRTLTGAALDHLGVVAGTPDFALLTTLINAYTCTVPWESAARIVKRARTAETSSCPRWPHEFWMETRTRGTGGTCFESNYAFFTLLRALGYDGYLTINDMHNSVGCHTAIILRLEGCAWLVDVGMPLYTPIPLDPDAASTATSAFHTYTLTPEGADRYTVTRDLHPRPYCFTLIDRPVTAGTYRAATIEDYGDRGLFLDRVIVMKTVDGEVSRFDHGAAVPCIETFHAGNRSTQPLDPDPAETVARHFHIDADTVRTALAILAAK